MIKPLKQNAAAMNKGLLIFFLSIISLATGLYAQPTTTSCVDFEQFPAGLLLGPAIGLSPGDVILGEEGLSVSIEEIQYANGTTGFLNASINNDNFGGLEGNYIFMGNNSLLLDFSSAEGAVQQVCFDFVDGGGEENFSVNGSPVTITNDFIEIANLNIPGVNIDLTLIDANLLTGTVCITGVIESLLVGGQEFGVDNVCFGTATDCGILNLEAAILSCNEDSTFTIEVDFDHLSASANVAGFDLLINGEQRAFIAADTPLPHTLDVFAGPGQNASGNIIVTSPDVNTPLDILYLKALFGPDIPLSGVSGLVADALDNSANPTHACDDIVNADDIEGKIALMDRGSCPFEEKVLNAEAAGAIGAIICNFEEELVFMNGTDLTDPGIPAVSVTASTCAYLRQLLQNDDVEISILPTFAAPIELTICENDNPDCCSSILLEPDCLNEQPNDCITFDGLNEGVYGSSSSTPPGTAFFNENGIGLFLLPFQTLFWTTTYGDLNSISTASHPEMTAADGNYLQFESINAVFDLTAYTQPIDSITLDFYYTGGGINIAANGAAFLIQNNLQPGFFALAPGITVEVEYNPGSTAEGQLLFSGNVQSLLIGGEGDFRVDNLCINPTATCEISNLVVEASPCNPNNVFEVFLDFDYTGTSDSFELYLNGNATGQYYAYADLPLTLSPFVGPTPELEIKVVDAGNSNCSTSAILPAVDCNDGCPIEGAQVVEGPFCLAPGSNMYYAAIALDGVEFGTLVTATSNITGSSTTNAYFGQITFEFPTSNLGYDEIELCLVGSTPNTAPCCTTIAYDIACNPCEITDIVIEPLDCNADEMIFFEVDFNAEGIFADTFFLDLSNGYSAFFLYDDLPITLGPIPGNGDNLFVWIYDESENCIGNANLQTPDCSDGCILGEVTSNVLPGCNDDGTYNIPLSIENAQIGDLLFVYSTLTNYADTINYGVLNSPFLQISGWPIPDVQYDNLVICYFDDPNCCVAYEFDIPCNIPCDIDATVELLPCEPNGLLNFEVSAMVNNPNAYPFYSVTIEGQFFGLFGANSTVEVGQLINDGSFDQLDIIVEAWQNQNPNTGPVCADIITVDVSDCSSDCEIPGFEIQPIGCTGFGAYGVNLFFATDSLEGETLELYANGELVSSGVSPFQQYIEVFPYDPGQSDDIITVCYTSDPDCCESIAVEDPPFCDCGNIWGIFPEPLPCENGKYFVEVWVESDGFGFGTFGFEVDGVFQGYYTFDEVPITVGPFAGDGEGHSFFAFPEGDCQAADAFLDGIICDDPCLLPQVEAEVICNPNGEATLVVELFDIPDPNGGFYNIEIPGLFSQSIFISDPLTLSIDLPNVGVAYDMILCSANTPDCCEVYSVVNDCPEPCSVEAFVLDEPITCDNSTQTYMAYIFVEGVAVGDTIQITSEFSNAVAYYGVDPNGTVVPVNFPLTNQGLDVLEICSTSGSEECCTLLTIDIDCEFCYISDVNWYYECLADGQFTFHIDYIESQGSTASDGYFLTLFGYDDFFFTQSDLPLTFGPFTTNNNNPVVEFIIENANCEPFFSEFILDCEPIGCNFNSVITEPHSCNNGSFMLDIEVDVNEPGALGYYIFANNEIFGPFSYNETFVTIGPLVGDGETAYNLLLLDIANPACFSFVELEPVDCADEACDIHNLTITTQDCTSTGTYGITIDFYVENPTSSHFQVFGSNGIPLGFYPIASLPVTIQGISPSNVGFNEITVCINNDLNCCESQLISEPDCPGNCEISDVEVAFAFCDTSGFYVQLSFDANGNTGGTYKVLGNGQTYGVFTYGNTFPIIGPFSPFTDNVYELIVMDMQNTGCMGFTEFVAFDCDDCEIVEVDVTSTDCDNNGDYTLALLVEVENANNDFVDVFGANGDFLGFYPLNGDIIQIQGITPNDTGVSAVTVCVNDNPDCCMTVSYIEPICNDACTISNVNTDFAFCDTSGYYVQLSFDVVNPASDGYVVFGNGQNYGSYPYDQPFPVIGPFSPDIPVIYELIVSDFSNDECTGFTSFSYDCEEPEEDCLVLEEYDTAVYNPENDYTDGSLILEWAGGNINFETLGEPCNICAVEIAAANDYPDFVSASGNLFKLQSGGLEFDFGNTNGLTRSLTFDFDELIDSLIISINGNPYQQVSLGDGNEYMVIDGVEMIINFNYNTWDGTITFQGALELLSIYTLEAFLMDNICTSTFEDNTDCVDFSVFDNILDTIILGGWNDPASLYYEENDVIITGTTIETSNNPEYFSFAAVTSESYCNFETEGASLYVNGGIQVDYTEWENLPSSVTFDIGFCPPSNSKLC
jgi:hypothetical protein